MKKFLIIILIIGILAVSLVPTTGPVNAQAGTQPSSDPWDQIDSCVEWFSINPIACIEYVVYFFFVSVPSFFLYYAAAMFDFLAALTLSDHMYRADSIQTIWEVVRDFSNIFFILILLFAAFQTILGIGHGGAQKTIAMVVILALIVNFSLFFTKVVIDSGNILALVFYNKIQVVEPVNAPPKPSIFVANVKRRAIAESLVNNFNINRFFNKAFTPPPIYVNNRPVNIEVPAMTLMAMMILYGIIIYALVYAFVIAGLSFLSRTLSLMLLMIVSPFALVSSALPELKGIKQVGFTDWIHKLISTTFVSVLFMFLLYIAVIISGKGVFGGVLNENGGMIEQLLAIFVPAILIIAILLFAAKHAKTASGQFTDKIIGLAKAGAGLALGGAALGTAVAGRATVGAFMKGASTGDTAANRMQGSQLRIQNLQNQLANAGTFVERDHLRKQIRRERKDQIVGTLQGFGWQQSQAWVGQRLNQDQHNVEHAAHARHDLDTAANDITHGRKKKWDDLNGEERYEARRKMERDRVVRDNAGAGGVAGGANTIPGLALANRKWDSLTTGERNQIDNLIGAQVGGPHAGQAVAGGRLAMNHTHADENAIPESRIRQGLISNVVQSTVTGSYDARGLAKVIAKEQSTAMAKLTMGITGAIALGMRGAIKQIGINHGEPQRAFFKDLGNTITDALKNLKVNVDLSKVGEEKKGDDHGGGHH